MYINIGTAWLQSNFATKKILSNPSVFYIQKFRWISFKLYPHFWNCEVIFILNEIFFIYLSCGRFFRLDIEIIYYFNASKYLYLDIPIFQCYVKMCIDIIINVKVYILCTHQIEALSYLSFESILCAWCKCLIIKLIDTYSEFLKDRYLNVTVGT